MSSPAPVRGRGTASNPHNRFAPSQSVAEDDGWYQEVPLTQGTTVTLETAKSIITRNTSPDIPFDRSSILIGAVNMAASIASPDPATPIGTCLQGSISRPD